MVIKNDLINSLNNDPIEPNESNISYSNTDLSIKGNTTLGNVGQHLNLNSLDNFSENNNLSKDKSQKEENKNINNLNKDDTNNNETKEDKDKISENSIKEDKINYLNDPLLAPIFIPKKIRAKFEEKKENKQDINSKLKEINISYKNKFDEENSEHLNNFSLNQNYEKAKMPFEIRIGDWICFFCNNLNFSFRKKCNRCGILKKSNTLLYDKKFIDNSNYNYSMKNSCNYDYLGKYSTNNNNI